ncbi:MAG: hypothetical protein U5O16_40670, partial [Rhodococcus sp. (in: high G+C Gram-positive bacteria)]|nr:hypothetical protein [Rhodococcus sp. (in: high G+C Gram-positive bacteria)]
MGASVAPAPPYSLQLLTQPGGSSSVALWNGPEFLAMVDQGLDAGGTLDPEAGTFWNQAELRMTDKAPYIFIAPVRPSVALEAGIRRIRTAAHRLPHRLLQPDPRLIDLWRT